MYHRKRLLHQVLGYMDEASCASELEEKVNILNIIMSLKSTLDTVTPESIEKCIIECVIVDTKVDGMVNEEDDANKAELLTVLSEANMTWQDYVYCDEDIATNQTLEIDWEKDLLASIREEKGNEQGSEEEELESTPVVDIKTATKHAYEL